MATYEFLCKKCNIHWEKQMSMSVKHVDNCPKCDAEVPSVVTGGTGFIFKCPGFPSHDSKKEKETGEHYKEVDEILPGKE